MDSQLGTRCETQYAPELPSFFSFATIIKEERIQRIAAAVSMIEYGSPAGEKLSVRKASRIYGIPKSSLHRYVQENRGIKRPSRRKRAKVVPKVEVCKSNIDFLLNEASFQRTSPILRPSINLVDHMTIPQHT